MRGLVLRGLCAALAAGALAAPWADAQGQVPQGNSTSQGNNALRVCADPHSMPQSNDHGEGYENKIAEALARDLGKKVEYTYFPQRMGFVRNTLRARDDQTQQFKCDLIIGVPKGYDITATTKPYMHSIYALVLTPRPDLKDLKTAEDLLKLPPEKLHTLRVGMFAQTPASDWVLKNGMIDHAVMYAAQSGDPNETPDTIIERDLAAGKIDVAVVWGPIAGFIVSRHGGTQGWTTVPFKPDPQIKFDYEISMGLRQGEKDWQKTLDDWIAAHHTEITQILTAYHIPLIDEAAPPQG
ncbi:MAG TPA: quinoprotein dehydrogenase-associated putative ABC transporter substrate-binding protein [Steroidobacteraceae bacterium]|jgi:quinoprotein dehydrogenase-associated probable ABC transporter substrate-binding protein|nr:quinoprotein dehydrogenase-associated putative ABC transporter substrate-binding protein [Steroidobacteraceae bacterium]